MTNLRLRSLFMAALVLCVISASPLSAQQQTPGRARFDVNHYRIEAELRPAENLLNAVGDVTFTPLDATRSVVFELNGSLKVESIERDGRPLTNFVQDAVGVDTIGPSVRVDLGEVVAAGQPVTLRFRWGGALVTPEGGPLATKRLAYVGNEGSYLMYAARWFPFHEYAADRATAEITIAAPAGFEIAGYSDEASTQALAVEVPARATPATPTTPARTPAAGGRTNAPRAPTGATTAAPRPYVPAPLYLQTAGNVVRRRFVQRQPALVGNFAVGRYITRTLKFGNYDIQFFVFPGNERRIDHYGELVGGALAFYTKQYGTPAFGSRFVVAQIDDQSLDAYAAPGMQFLSARYFDPNRTTGLDERVQRELAFQWWGHTVGLRSFDDVWLSQGLAEWSAYALRETALSGGALEAAQRDMQERALMFEQSASIMRAPSTLDDQSAAYQAIIYYKGAMVFRMLRETIGQQKFDELLRRMLGQYRGKNISIDQFENLANGVAEDNLRYFFARWVEGTGVPEFTSDYQIIRTRAGKFRARGTIKQNFENLRMPVEVALRAEGDDQTTTIFVQDKSEDFDFESNGKPLEIVVDPNYKILRTSEDLRIAVVARRGLELFREGQYLEAQRQLEEALKLDKSNSWVYYNLGLLFLEQRNYQQALDNFQAALAGNLKPAWIEVWAHIKRGNAYDAQGDRARAVTAYNLAVQTGINYDNAQRAAQEFLKTPYDPRANSQTASGATD